jgi:8-oxo-dGTP pyrophosphatase MutT (NUDIX family)
MNRDYPVYEYGKGRAAGHLRWKTGSEKLEFSGSIFSLFSVEHFRDDGRKADFLRLDTSDWVNVCALHQDSHGRPCLVMVRQFRPGAGASALELPGGMVDAGEDPRDAALRELTEETGFTASSIELLGSACPNAAFMGNTMHCYLARGLNFTGKRRLDENEIIDVELVPVDMLKEGRVPEFMVNGIMAIGWYYFTVWMSTQSNDNSGEKNERV